jgi:hypothetical protein
VALTFVQQHGGRRMRSYADQPTLEVPTGGGGRAAEDGGTGTVDLHVERPAGDWEPVDTAGVETDPSEVPQRFVDGSNVHETVAWLREPNMGYPVPVVMAELGGIAVAADGRDLRREFAIVERAVAMAVDAFPWDEVEAFTAALLTEGWRLLPARRPTSDDEADADPEVSPPPPAYDFERSREQARVAVLHEMAALEEVAWGHQPGVPTLLDGRLGRLDGCNLGRHDVVGVIKRQTADYLHPRGWQTFYQLAPGQRTPAFVVPSKHLDVLTWYLKLAGADGEMPNWGVVRVEVPCEQFDARGGPGGGGFAYVDRLSAALVGMRCRGGAYARGPVSLDPIVRAEQSLKSLFTAVPTLARHFYRLAGI